MNERIEPRLPQADNDRSGKSHEGTPKAATA